MKSSHSFKKQLLDNAMAIISLVIAISALFYTTWRNETTERNFNIRAAGFTVLQSLGQLQALVNFTHYDPKNPAGNPMLGWGYVSLIGDLSELLPPPIPGAAANLVETWGKDWTKIKDDEQAALEVSDKIDHARAVVLMVLKDLQ